MKKLQTFNKYFQPLEQASVKISMLELFSFLSYSSKFGIQTTFHSQMLKVWKTTKNDFNSKFNIIRSAVAKASKVCVTPSIALSNSSAKFGTLNTFHSEMLKVCKTIKNDLNWKFNISQITVVEASKFWVSLRLAVENFSAKLGNLFSFRNAQSLKINQKWLQIKS